jgi:hypothetical protein
MSCLSYQLHMTDCNIPYRKFYFIYSLGFLLLKKTNTDQYIQNARNIQLLVHAYFAEIGFLFYLKWFV